MKTVEVNEAGDAKKKAIKDDLDAAADPKGGYMRYTMEDVIISGVTAPPVPKTTTNR